MENAACVYSNICTPTKHHANTIVSPNPTRLSLLDPIIIPWCAHVTAAPDTNKINVFNKGISMGSNALIAGGNHTPPNSIVGAKAE